MSQDASKERATTVTNPEELRAAADLSPADVPYWRELLRLAANQLERATDEPGAGYCTHPWERVGINADGNPFCIECLCTLVKEPPWNGTRPLQDFIAQPRPSEPPCPVHGDEACVRWYLNGAKGHCSEHDLHLYMVEGKALKDPAGMPPPHIHTPTQPPGADDEDTNRKLAVLQLLDRARQELIHTCDTSSECLACDIDITLQPASRPTKEEGQ
jgi:hypothetical protein